MATDATGTPSANFAFPKFNTSVDAPSGLGSNAIVDDIDSKLGLVSTLLGALARVSVRKNSAGSVFSRRRLNLIEGAGVTLTVADDSGNEEVDITIATSGTPVGALLPYAGMTAPSGYLMADGSSQLRASFTDLFAALSAAKSTFTVTIASPAVFTNVAHGLVVGDAVYLTTTGALPTGLAADTTYYVIAVPTADTFQVSATRGGAAINTSGTQSGTHNLFHAPWGVADATHFNLPDGRGRVLVGKGTHANVDGLGEDDATAVANRRPQHYHTEEVPSTSFVGGSNRPNPGTDTAKFASTSETGGTKDAPSYVVVNYIIKT